MTLEEQFRDAQARVKALSRTPSSDDLLALYSFYKQGTEGDNLGKRPGMLDIKGRAKFDAWASKRGLSRDAAMKGYVALVDRLVKE